MALHEIEPESSYPGWQDSAAQAEPVLTFPSAHEDSVRITLESDGDTAQSHRVDDSAVLSSPAWLVAEPGHRERVPLALT